MTTTQKQKKCFPVTPELDEKIAECAKHYGVSDQRYIEIMMESCVALSYPNQARLINRYKILKLRVLNPDVSDYSEEDMRKVVSGEFGKSRQENK